MQSYAGPLLDILDPDHTTFEHRLFRDSCLRVPSHSQPGLAFLMKDMSALGRDLSSTVIVDNTPTVRAAPCITCDTCRVCQSLLVCTKSEVLAA